MLEPLRSDKSIPGWLQNFANKPDELCARRNDFCTFIGLKHSDLQEATLHIHMAVLVCAWIAAFGFRESSLCTTRAEDEPSA